MSLYCDVDNGVDADDDGSVDVDGVDGVEDDNNDDGGVEGGVSNGVIVEDGDEDGDDGVEDDGDDGVDDDSVDDGDDAGRASICTADICCCFFFFGNCGCGGCCGGSKLDFPVLDSVFSVNARIIPRFLSRLCFLGLSRLFIKFFRKFSSELEEFKSEFCIKSLSVISSSSCCCC